MNKLYLAPTTLPDTAAVEYMDAAAAAGFDGIGLRLNRSPGLPFYPVAGDPAVVREVKRALARSGLPVLDILSFYLQAETDVRAFAGALELGAEIGARYVMVIGDDPEWTRLRDNFGRLCDAAAAHGLACSLEFATQRRVGRLSEALRLIAEAGRSNTVLCLDFLHLARSGGGPDDLRSLDPKLLPYAQITDGLVTPAKPDLRARGTIDTGLAERRMPGEGGVPIGEILGALPAGLPLSVEVPAPEIAGVSAHAWAKTVAEGTRRFLEAYYRAKSPAPQGDRALSPRFVAE
jgi:sugar phosphate isomerase/epimerase